MGLCYCIDMPEFLPCLFSHDFANVLMTPLNAQQSSPLLQKMLQNEAVSNADNREPQIHFLQVVANSRGGHGNHDKLLLATMTGYAVMV